MASIHLQQLVCNLQVVNDDTECTVQDVQGLPEVIPTKMALYEVTHQFLVIIMLKYEE